MPTSASTPDQRSDRYARHTQAGPTPVTCLPHGMRPNGTTESHPPPPTGAAPDAPSARRRRRAALYPATRLLREDPSGYSDPTMGELPAGMRPIELVTRSRAVTERHSWPGWPSSALRAPAWPAQECPSHAVLRSVGQPPSMAGPLPAGTFAATNAAASRALSRVPSTPD
jgi:hypothetical protein